MATEPEVLFFATNGWVPNNERLPVLIYHRALKLEGDPAARFEHVFGSHDWPAQWRSGIYDFHHYHSTAHEVLGVAHGSAQVELGGPSGHVLHIAAGDVLILPVGTGHCCLEHTQGFLVVGGYPHGEKWDICRDAPDADTLNRMKSLPVPKADPVHGHRGALLKYWQ